MRAIDLAAAIFLEQTWQIHKDVSRPRSMILIRTRRQAGSTRNEQGISRREAMTTTGKIAAVSALAGVAGPAVHAGEEHTGRAARVGRGGRGTGAAANALATSGPTRLVAMADVFQNRLTSSLQNLERGFAKQVDVPQARRFVGFDGYRRAMDSLKRGDVVVLATPP